MAVLYIIAGVIALFLLVTAGIYFFAFSSPRPFRTKDTKLPSGVQYEYERERMLSMITELAAVPCEDVWIRSYDGLRLHGRLPRGRGLAAAGVDHSIEGDDLIIRGAGRAPGGGMVATHMDHRIAMSFLVMGLATDQPMSVDDTGFIATSFPDFVPLMRQLGADFA